MPDEATTTEQQTPAADTTAAADKEQPSTETHKPDDKAEKAFTQKDLDDAIQRRLAREAKKQEELETQLKELAAYRQQVEDEKKKREEELAAKELERAKEKGEFEKVLKLSEEQYDAKVKAKAEEIAKVQAERDAFRTELEKTKIDTALYAEASKLAVDPNDVVALIKGAHQISLDSKTHQIVVDGDSETSLEQVVRSFLDKKPHLARSDYAGTSGGGSPTTKPSVTGKPTYTRAQLRDSEFFAANKEDIMLAMTEGRIKS